MKLANSENPVMYVHSMAVFLNRWYASYEDARAARDAEGGFLFPHGNQYFLADGGAVAELGLDPLDPDWERIGWDWVRPLDAAAWERLRSKREMAR